MFLTYQQVIHNSICGSAGIPPQITVWKGPLAPPPRRVKDPAYTVEREAGSQTPSTLLCCYTGIPGCYTGKGI